MALTNNYHNTFETKWEKYSLEGNKQELSFNLTTKCIEFFSSFLSYIASFFQPQVSGYVDFLTTSHLIQLTTRCPDVETCSNDCIWQFITAGYCYIGIIGILLHITISPIKHTQHFVHNCMYNFAFIKTPLKLWQEICHTALVHCAHVSL